MPLELRTGRGGRLRSTWYGRYEANNRRYTINLGVKVSGQPPASLSLRDAGSPSFERSRAQAQARLDQIAEEAQHAKNTVHLAERVYELRTGERLSSPQLADLATAWASLPRGRKPNGRYMDQCRSTLKRFSEYARNAKCDELAQVTRRHARAFMDMEEKRGVTAKTWNDTLKLLRAACRHLLPEGSINPFSGIPTQDVTPVFRVPFSPTDLRAIVDAARADEFIQPIITTGMCTAMRRGDCCLLRWADVDLAQRFISVKTSKTGQTVSIPIFPMLYAELARRSPGGEYVFPEQAAMYLSNPDGITRRVQAVLARAGFVSSRTAEKIKDSEGMTSGLATKMSPEDILVMLPAPSAQIAAGDGKRERMRQVLTLYLTGKSVRQVAAETGLSRSTVSLHLNEVERATGAGIIRRTVVARVSPVVRGLTDAARSRGRHRASIRDFHSFRVTWVTLALTAGVPIELVMRVTGHQTTDVVLKHYFQPGREEFRRALQTAMPDLLTAGEKPPKEQLREIITAMSSATCQTDKPRLLALLDRL